MKRVAATIVLALTTALLPGRAEAVVTRFHYQKWVPSGRKGLFGTSAELDLNCRLLQVTRPTIVDEPRHGRVLFARGMDFPKFNRENPHYRCSFQKHPGIRVYYQSRPGFVGSDQFTIEEFASTGDVNVSTFDVTVQ